MGGGGTGGGGGIARGNERKCRQIPFLIVGTKLASFMSTSSDTLPRRRVRGCDHLQEELDAEEIFVDADDAAAFRLGSGNAVKLSRFFDRAVERRLRTNGGAPIRSSTSLSSAAGAGSGDTNFV